MNKWDFRMPQINKWNCKIKWCKKKGYSPANSYAWALAEKEYIEYVKSLGTKTEYHRSSTNKKEEMNF